MLQKQIPVISFVDTYNTSGNYGAVYFSEYTGVKGSLNFSVWANTDPAEEMIALRIDVDNLRVVLDKNKQRYTIATTQDIQNAIGNAINNSY